MALSIPIEFCNYLLNRSGGMVKLLFINLELDCNKAKEADKLDNLELAKETIPTITCDAFQHSGKNVSHRIFRKINYDIISLLSTVNYVLR